MSCNDFAESLSCCGSAFNGCLYCSDVASYHYRYESASDFFCSYKFNVCSFEHCICCLDSSNQSSCFYHT